jgi:hypothetical protein
VTTLSEPMAHAVATRVVRALSSAGASVTALHVQESPAGLLLTARFGDRTGSVVIPPGLTATWEAVAHDLLAESQLLVMGDA